MGNLVKMDLRRLFHSPITMISMAVAAVLNILIQFVVPVLGMVFAPGQKLPDVEASDLIVNPFGFPWSLIFMFAAVVAFSYADIANGFIKNLAGQVKKKSYTVISKFIVTGIYNALFLCACALTNLLGALIVSAVFGAKLEFDAAIAQAFGMLAIKWMLLMGVCAILMFVTTGLRVKTLASVVGVLLGTGSLALVYLGLDQAIASIFKVSGFSLSNYMPDTLASEISLTSGASTIFTAIIVAVVCIVLFMALTVKVFGSRDIK